MALVTRRNLLIGGAAAAGLLVAWSAWPRSYDADPYVDGDDAVFNGYLRVARNGTVTVAVPQCEMGQGVTTTFAQIVAVELGADWRTVAILPVPPAPGYRNPVLAAEWAELALPGGWSGTRVLRPAGSEASPPDETEAWLAGLWQDRADFVLTAGSSDVAAFEAPLREAAAAARVMLCKAAARQWDIAWESCDAANGFVRHEDREIRFADLIETAINESVPDPVPLRQAAAREEAGAFDRDELAFPRLDLPAKVDGTLSFAGDARLPDMVYAALRRGPPGDSTLLKIDRAAAESVTGLIDVVKSERWVATVATNWWAANQALAKLAPVFQTRGVRADDASIAAALAAAWESGEGGRMFRRGDPDTRFAVSSDEAREYRIGAAPHAAIETASATARLIEGRLELWIASQAPEAARKAAADALGVAANKVVLYPMMAGGSFDARLDHEVAAQAALLARQMRRPVQLVWSRGEEMIQDHVRTPAAIRVRGFTRADGGLDALSVQAAMPATMRELGRRLFHGERPDEAMRAVRGQYDALALRGAIPPYAIEHLSIDHFPADIGISTGPYRGNGWGIGCFAVESFIDELAHQAKREPLSYRIQMLSGVPRMAACLQAVGDMAAWEGLESSGQGIACCALHGAHIAVIAEARRAEGGIRVDRLYAAVDAGEIVNRDIAAQQIEGGLIFGTAMALGGATGYERGLATARHLRDLALPYLADAPEIDIRFLASDNEPAGLGEIGVPAVAPAIANALFSATGGRIRTLPLTGRGVPTRSGR